MYPACRVNIPPETLFVHCNLVPWDIISEGTRLQWTNRVSDPGWARAQLRTIICLSILERARTSCSACLWLFQTMGCTSGVAMHAGSCAMAAQNYTWKSFVVNNAKYTANLERRSHEVALWLWDWDLLEVYGSMCASAHGEWRCQWAAYCDNKSPHPVKAAHVRCIGKHSSMLCIGGRQQTHGPSPQPCSLLDRTS